MLNTRMTKEEAPWWAVGAPAIGVPLMVAVLALTAPKRETPVDGADLGPTTEQLDRQAGDHASVRPSECTERPSGS